MRAQISLSATNSIYCFIKVLLIPMSSTGRASETKSFSISTASEMISITLQGGNLFTMCWQIKHAKSVCNPSSLEISSLEKVSPGIKDRFLSQNMEQKLPEKNMPSMAAKATNLSVNTSLWLIHFMAQLAFLAMTGMLWIASKRYIFSVSSLMQVSISNEQVSEWMFSIAIQNPQKHLASGT